MSINHNYVPKHFIMAEDDFSKVAETFNISKSDLPLISSSDVVVKSTGAKIGDVLKIVRMSPITRKEEVFYRLVVE